MIGQGTIQNNEPELPETTAGPIRSWQDQATGRGADDDVAQAPSNAREPGELSQLEVIQKSYYNAQARKENAKAAFFSVAKWAVGVFVGLLAVAGVVWAYNVNSVAEPIGGLKADVENLKKTVEEDRNDVKDLQDRQRDAELKLDGHLQRVQQ